MFSVESRLKRNYVMWLAKSCKCQTKISTKRKWIHKILEFVPSVYWYFRLPVEPAPTNRWESMTLVWRVIKLCVRLASWCIWKFWLRYTPGNWRVPFQCHTPQQEINLPTIIFEGRAVRLRGSKGLWTTIKKTQSFEDVSPIKNDVFSLPAMLVFRGS